MLAARLHKTATTIAGNRDDADDALQELFVTLARDHQKFAQVIDLNAYLFASLRYSLLALLRRRARERHHLEQLAAQRRQEIPATSIADDELAAALDAVPVEQREVIALKVDGELTFAQIAQVLGISGNTAASRYRYALEKLRSRLES